MSDQDLRGPIADVRSFLAQIDNAVDPITREAGGLVGGSRRPHPQTGDNSNGIRAATKHLPYNGGISATAGEASGDKKWGGDRHPSRTMGPDQLRKLVRRWAIPIIVITILGATASYVVSRRLTPTYAASGSVLVVAGPGGAAGAGAISINAAEATTTAASLITNPALLQQVITALDLPTSPSLLSKNVAAVADANTELVNVTVTDPSPARAAKIANALMNAYVVHVTKANNARIGVAGAAFQKQINAVQATVNQEEQQLGAEATAGQDTTAIRAAISTNGSLLTQLNLNYATFEATQAQLLDTVSIAAAAAIPSLPTSPNVLLNTVGGALVALFVGTAVAYAREYFDQGLKNADDVRVRLGLTCLESCLSSATSPPAASCALRTIDMMKRSVRLIDGSASTFSSPPQTRT